MLPVPIPFVPRTKLRPPRLPDDVLLRSRLLKRLDRAQVLALIIAPAGYGKTILAGTWLAHAGRPCAWMSLEREDNTLPVFLAGLVSALRRVFPTYGSEVLALLQDPAVELTPALLLPLLLNELDMLEQDFVLVLDDCHHIRSAAIHELLWGLLTYPPRPLQLILTTRRDPPIPPRIRCRSVEIRARDLCFTTAEAGEFLNRCAAQPLDPQSVATLVEQSEGWAVPLRLVALLLSRQQDAISAVVALHRCERSLLDYLDAEVIGRLCADIQAFLMYTSLLPRLTGSLCDAVIGDLLAVDSAALLTKLAEDSVFIEDLGEDGGWFRYHELFRSLLQRRLRTTVDQLEIEGLDERARVWYAQHGLPAALYRHGCSPELKPSAEPLLRPQQWSLRGCPAQRRRAHRPCRRRARLRMAGATCVMRLRFARWMCCCCSTSG
jgi:LuxR family maltose regulon positive regulatory protein